MRVSRIAATWFAARIAAGASPAPTLYASLTDGDEAAPDRISFVWSEEVEPVCPPLHIYDLLVEIRTPAAGIITPTQHAAAEAFFDSVLSTSGNYGTFATALAAVGTLADWFIGKDGRAMRYESAIVTERTIRAAIVHT
jgi:hypothetical protein